MGGSASLIPRDFLSEYQVPTPAPDAAGAPESAQRPRNHGWGALGQALAALPALTSALPAGADVPEQAGDLAVSTGIP
ncbi:hypothetical protein Nmel_013776 [Mimus melanotis]